MPEIFNDREKALEEKYARAQEADFEDESRALRHLALWAAAQLGLREQAADRYADEVLNLFLGGSGMPKLFDKIRADLAKKDVTVSARHLASLLSAHKKRLAAD